VLMDFGTGKDLRLQPLPGVAGGDLAGTPLYLAPEVFGGAPRSRLTDIYSLGVLLFHLVTNGYPVDGRTQADVEAGHRSGARTRLRDLRPDLPAEFVGAVEQATAVNPEERFQTVGAFEAALARFLGRPPEPLPAPTPRRRWIAAAAVVVLATIGATALWKYWPPQTAAPLAPTPAPSSTGLKAAAASSYQIDAAF